MKTSDGKCEFCGSSQSDICRYGQSCGLAPTLEDIAEEEARQKIENDDDADSPLK